MSSIKAIRPPPTRSDSSKHIYTTCLCDAMTRGFRGKEKCAALYPVPRWLRTGRRCIGNRLCES
ncbi:hypothetical protein BV25DRAFT_1823689 [Artomyces pyxidatus]|uniref:Uncharacterized protein n=1 Tax=Artomyces pyxidatus TaxID=48021 RepID=A0ACB8T7L1_9AGAM|nr:hypothetical protein BV25DRAFT_1823689 [Artomyces pyxidatus]